MLNKIEGMITKTTIKFQCPHVGCGEWIITTLEHVCNFKGFYCSFCNKLIHPSMVFGVKFGTGSLAYEKEFLACTGSHVVELDDMAQKNTRLVWAGKISLAKARTGLWKGVEKVFRLVRVFKGYNYDHSHRWDSTILVKKSRIRKFVIVVGHKEWMMSYSNIVCGKPEIGNRYDMSLAA